MNQVAAFDRGSQDRVAVLIDGENVSCARADEIFHHAEREGQPKIIRIYGAASTGSKWLEVPGARYMHSGAGKNSADLLLSIEACHLMHTSGIRRFVLVSSDGDLSHIATFLRENGCHVAGIGEAKAPDRFRMSCDVFHTLRMKQTEANICDVLMEIIRDCGDPHGARIADLNALMRRKIDVKVSTLEAKTWRNYLAQRADLFAIDPKGPNSRVRLKAKSSAST